MKPKNKILGLLFTFLFTYFAPVMVATSLFPHSAHAQDLSAGEILNNVAETYRQVSSFSLVAEGKIDRDTNVHDTEFIEVTLITSNSSKAKLILKDGKKEIVVVSNGKLVWTMLSAQHEYTVTGFNSGYTRVVTPGMGSNDITAEGLLTEYEFLMTSGFRTIARHKASSKLDHSETVKVGKDKKACYVLTVEMAEGSQKLWVDKIDFTVWRSAITTVHGWDPPGATIKVTSTLTMKQVELNPTLDDSNFVFTPPDQAKQVDSLTLSGRNPF